MTISIHALLAESDSSSLSSRPSPLHFYPRSPCGERLCACMIHTCTQRISIHALLAESDRHWQTGQSRTRQFLSTLSLRRATRAQQPFAIGSGYFYPRSPCGERHRAVKQLAKDNISIHALLAESDCNQLLFDTLELISIHALLAESDGKQYG